jgi:hypothetical protein
MRGEEPWTRYINLLDWEEDEIEDEPEILSDEDAARLLSYLGKAEPQLITPRRRPRRFPTGKEHG